MCPWDPNPASRAAPLTRTDMSPHPPRQLYCRHEFLENLGNEISAWPGSSQGYKDQKKSLLNSIPFPLALASRWLFLSRIQACKIHELRECVPPKLNLQSQLYSQLERQAKKKLYTLLAKQACHGRQAGRQAGSQSSGHLIRLLAILEWDFSSSSSSPFPLSFQRSEGGSWVRERKRAFSFLENQMGKLHQQLQSRVVRF